eukprot:EG_transcript_15070
MGPCSFHSQSGEDELLVERFFRGLRNGTFVEIGALDGILYSNTLYFERCLGWSGRLIEGSLYNFRQLQHNLPSRPLSEALQSAVCQPPATTVKFTVGGGLTAGAQPTLAKSFLKQWHQKRVKYEEVPCAPMSALLQGMTHIDFWSLDVEGAELVAVQTVEWAAVQIDVIVVELDEHSPPKNLQVRQILHTVGYVECRWGSLRANNALFLSNASRYVCGDLGNQTCLCSYHDCGCDGMQQDQVVHKTPAGRRWVHAPVKALPSLSNHSPS